MKLVQDNNTEGAGIPPASPPDSRRVFTIPVTYSLTARLYVLATDLTAARDIAVMTDLDALLAIDARALWSNDVKALEFDDYDLDIVHNDLASPADPDVYPANTHPDWLGIPIK